MGEVLVETSAAGLILMITVDALCSGMIRYGKTFTQRRGLKPEYIAFGRAQLRQLTNQNPSFTILVIIPSTQA